MARETPDLLGAQPAPTTKRRRPSKIAGVEAQVTTMLPYLGKLVIANIAVSVIGALAVVAVLLFGPGR